MKEVQQDDRLNFWTMNKIEQKTGTKKRIRFASKIKLSLLLKFWLTTCLSRKTSVTDWTFEGPLFGVGSVMNFKRRLASKNLEANLACCVATGCKKPKKSGIVSRFCGSKKKIKSSAFSNLVQVKHYYYYFIIHVIAAKCLSGEMICVRYI